MKLFQGILILTLFLCAYSEPILAQNKVEVDSTRQDTVTQYSAYLASIIDTHKVHLSLEKLPNNVLQQVESLNINRVNAGDFLRALGLQYDVNIVVSSKIKKEVTLRFSQIPVIEVMIFVAQEYDMQLEQTGSVFKVRDYIAKEIAPQVAEPIIEFENNLLTLDIKDLPLDEFVRTISQKTGANIVIRNGVKGTISGFLQQISFDDGLNTIFINNGYSLRNSNGVLVVDRIGFRGNQSEGEQRNTFWVAVEDGQITMDVVDANITDLIREIGYQTDVNMITYGLPTNNITAKIKGLTIEQTLTFLFRGTSFTYRKEGDIFIIGDKATSGIASTRLIRLQHIRSDVVMELIPANLKSKATIQIVKEQNGLMIIGTNDIILELENYIREIDHPTPQIMIEALVVDVQTSDMYQLGVSLAQGGAPDSSSFNPFSMLFGQGQKQNGGLNIQGTGTDVNNAFATGGNLFGVANLGKLPSDFFFRIQALDQEGIVNIRSRPQISTLNGYKASIEIGTTQYYLLTSTTPLQSPNNIVTQESQRFEKIEANVLLEITPWVSASGEVTAEIHPEFNTPVGGLNPDIPPTINSRILDSTVRLRDGETIILGGLIQESESESINKVPILGSIPLLGRLFRNKSTTMAKSELVIFITPHVFYGDESDNERWKRLRNDLDLSIDK
ncbi:MAG: hypothetical protein WC967_14265 [Balneolaceae bacterium]